MTKPDDAATAAATDVALPIARIFITGGSGYVGRNLIRHFVGGVFRDGAGAIRQFGACGARPRRHALFR